jgi:hypothetical protein
LQTGQGAGAVHPINARLRDELLDGEIFYMLAEARIIIESWRRFYNTLRPHGSLGYKPPAPEVFIPASARAAAHSQPALPPRTGAQAVNALSFYLNHPMLADQHDLSNSTHDPCNSARNGHKTY